MFQGLSKFHWSKSKQMINLIQFRQLQIGRRTTSEPPEPYSFKPAGAFTARRHGNPQQNMLICETQNSGSHNERLHFTDPTGPFRIGWNTRWKKKLRGVCVLVCVLTMHGSDAFKALEIPQLDSHVRRAGRKQLSSLVKRDILYRVRVALQRALKISRLVVPHLHDKTFTRLSKYCISLMTSQKLHLHLNLWHFCTRPQNPSGLELETGKFAIRHLHVWANAQKWFTNYSAAAQQMCCAVISCWLCLFLRRLHRHA